MIDELQNRLLTTEAAGLRETSLRWNCRRLQQLRDFSLSHTKYYRFILKIVVEHTMGRVDDSSEASEKWNQEVDDMRECPEVMVDLLKSMREWLYEPWNNFLQGDLTEYFVESKGEHSGSSVAEAKN